MKLARGIEIISVIISGYPRAVLRDELRDGPVLFYNQQLAKCSVPVEAYMATVNEFVEGVFVGRGFARYKGYYESLGLTSASGHNDAQITAPSAASEEGNTEVGLDMSS